MIRVKLTAPHGVVREGERITLQAGDTISVSERQFNAFRDRMVRFPEGEAPAGEPSGQNEQSASDAPSGTGPQLVLTDGSTAPEGEGHAENAGEPEGEPSEPDSGPGVDPAPDSGEQDNTGFASPTAAARAAAEGVTVEQLRAAGEPSGQNGYTVADVVAVVNARSAS